MQVPEHQIDTLLSLIQQCRSKGAAYDEQRIKYEAMLLAAKKKPPTPPAVLAIHRNMDAEIASMTTAAATSCSSLVDLLERVQSTLLRMADSNHSNHTELYQIHFDCKFNAYTRLASALTRRVGPLSAPTSSVAPITPITFTAVNDNDARYQQLEKRVVSSMPGAVLSSVRAINAPYLVARYTHYRDTVLGPISDRVNEALLFHGTRGIPPSKLLLDHGDEGLEPRVSRGGLYGYGTYLAFDPNYVVNGGYGYRRPDGNIEVLAVQTTLGIPKQLGGRVDRLTRDLRMPPTRVGSRPPVKYGSVVGGPHTANQSSSKIACVYKSEQLLPVFILEIKMRPPPRGCNRKRPRYK